MEFHQGGRKSCTGSQGRFNSIESKFQNKRFDSRTSTEYRKEREMKIDSFLGSERNNKNQQFDVENCNKLNFYDQNFIDQYILKLEKKICRLQSTSPSETSIKNAPLEIRENSCQKINNCDKESSFREIKMKKLDPITLLTR